jgi:hypothetical protein
MFWKEAEYVMYSAKMTECGLYSLDEKRILSVSRESGPIQL